GRGRVLPGRRGGLPEHVADLVWRRMKPIMSDHESPPQSAPLTLEQALQQAIAHHQAGRLQDAERLYRAILQAQPNHPDANHNLGVLALQVKQPLAGLPHFKAALEANPNHDQFWLSYIDALIQAGQAEAARQVLAQGRQRGLQGEAVEALLVSSSVFQSNNKKPKTKPGELSKSAKKFTPYQENNPPLHEIDALTALFNEGRYTEAETHAKTMTASFPQNGFGWKALGVILVRMGRNAEALKPLQKAAALMPGDAEVHSNLGATLGDLGQLNGAVASFRKALKIKPDFAEAHSNLGNALRDLGQLSEAVASFHKALEIKPDYAEAHNNLGVIQKNMGQLDEAEVSYRRALEISQEFVDARKNLGNILQDKGLKWPPRLYNAGISADKELLKPLGMMGNVYNVNDFEKFSRGIELIKESLFDKGATLYCSDNLITWNRNYSFLRSNYFLDILHNEEIGSPWKSIVWRTYVLLYFAEIARKAEGDYVELGCHTGHTALQVISKLNFSDLHKKYYLYDLFEWNKGDEHTHLEGHDDPLMYEKVLNLFCIYNFVKIVKGSVPQSFVHGFPEKVAFAHLDMNHPDPEAGALKVVLPKLSKGGVVILDDYGWWGYRAQKIVLDPIISENGLTILELPTGQGLIIR
ncbi:MAG: tetratricopeptide repeat protein, partial [Sterolibacterium sp.]|nr:tetratricopeptide repeat protein [Sterolibacterium sp.]